MNNIVFTLNNPITNGGPTLCDWIEDHCSYAIIGCETGKEGTFHWQGYAELRKKIRFNTVAKAGKWHIEIRRGSQHDAIKYCKKDGNFVEWGIPRVQGERKDLDVCRSLASSEGMRAVSAVCNLQGIKVAEHFLTYNEEPRNWQCEVIYITGPSGAGKSRLAREIVADQGYEDDCYTKNDASKWWQGYDRHKAIIIDDYRDSWWPATEFLRVTDRYECRVETKGGYRQLVPLLIIITSIKAPDTLYVNNCEINKQFLRRLTRLIVLNDKGVPDVPEVGGVILEPPQPYWEDPVYDNIADVGVELDM